MKPAPPVDVLRFAEGPDLNRRVALSVKETAAVLGVSERHVRSLMPELPSVSLGSRTVVPVDALRRWLEERLAAPGQQVDEIVDEMLGSLE